MAWYNTALEAWHGIAWHNMVCNEFLWPDDVSILLRIVINKRSTISNCIQRLLLHGETLSYVYQHLSHLMPDKLEKGKKGATCTFSIL